MGRVHRLRGPTAGASVARAAPAALAALVLAGCSGGHGSAANTTTVPHSTSSVLAPATTSGPGPTGPGTGATTSPTPTSVPTTVPTVPTVPTTAPSTGPGGDHVSIDGFAVTPGSPVVCNAPTSVELSWTSTGADTVELAIDGSTVATYGPGAQDHLAYLACDGKAHTYTLTAQSGGAHVTTSRTVSTQRR